MHLSIATTIFALVVISVNALRPFQQRGDGLAIPLTKHSSLALNADYGIDFDALDAHAEYVMAKIARGLDNYERNMNTSYAANYSSRKRGVGTSLTSHGKNSWYATVAIGTPPTSFFLDIDTGSADLIVPAVTCDASCEGHTRWDPRSENAKPVGERCNIRYADGSRVTGHQYTDNVTIAGLMAQTQTLCAATKYSYELSRDMFVPDGIMGMALKSLSAYEATSLIETLINEKTVTNEAFSLNLSLAGGELYIGGTNRDLYKDDLIYTDVSKESKGYWQVRVENVQGKDSEEPILDGFDVIIDTGCVLIIGDQSRVSKLHGDLGGKYLRRGYYTYPCDSFPDVKFTFNGKSFLISASTLNVGPIEAGSPKCLSAIVAKELISGFWSMGGVFLRNVYTSFDYENRRVGFAEHV